MQRAVFRTTTLLLGLSLLVGRATAGPITYDLVDYADYQNGFTLSGSITTDGYIGEMTGMPERILSWTVTISQPGYSYTFDSSPAGSGVGFWFGRVFTSETELWIGRLPLFDPYYWNTGLALYNPRSDPARPDNLIQWIIGWGGTAYDATSQDRIDGNYWHTSPPFVESFVIARVSSSAVPEPASLAMSACGAVVASFGLRRRPRG